MERAVVVLLGGAAHVAEPAAAATELGVDLGGQPHDEPYGDSHREEAPSGAASHRAESSTAADPGTFGPAGQMGFMRVTYRKITGVNTRVLVAAIGAAVLVAAGAVLFLSRGSSTPVESDVATAPPAGVSPAPVEPPAAPGAPVPEPARESRRAAAAPTASTEPAAAAEPVAEAAPTVGTLRIESDVPGAQVFIDRQFVGTAPVTAENVKPGTHQLNVSAEGFDGVARTIEVEAGPRDLMVRFREVRLDSRVGGGAQAPDGVVHRARWSPRRRACATRPPTRTTSSPSSFADVETFDVDYTEKNLRVKVRKGKQYNFTDPDGNADSCSSSTATWTRRASAWPRATRRRRTN